MKHPQREAAKQRLEQLLSGNPITQGMYVRTWGDHLIVVDPGNNARSVDLAAVRAGGAEWAGADIYAADPESLWIGVEASKGKGRFYARVTFSEVDGKAVPWPATAAAPPDCAASIIAVTSSMSR